MSACRNWRSEKRVAGQFDFLVSRSDTDGPRVVGSVAAVPEGAQEGAQGQPPE